MSDRARHAGTPLTDRAEAAMASKEGPRAHRHSRITTEPVVGSDLTPAPEPARSAGDENDDRLKSEKPPHY